MLENMAMVCSSHLGQSPAFLTCDDSIRFNEVVRSKWLIY